MNEYSSIEFVAPQIGQVKKSLEHGPPLKIWVHSN